MEFDWNLGPLSEGLRCYRREEFFVAHEHWEILWRKSQGAEKSFLQALIQMAGGFHHWQRHNLKGATALLKAARRRLEACPARYHGVEVAGLREELSRWLTALEAEELNARLPYPQLCADVVPERAGSER
jgi:predicted metal-dependent hydrolase